jgi:hypothetical protein
LFVQTFLKEFFKNNLTGHKKAPPKQGRSRLFFCQEALDAVHERLPKRSPLFAGDAVHFFVVIGRVLNVDPVLKTAHAVHFVRWVFANGHARDKNRWLLVARGAAGGDNGENEGGENYFFHLNRG